MLRPSTAPRWKIAISSFCRDAVAAAVRARNDGANPIVTIAIAPDFRKIRREVIQVSLFAIRSFRFREAPHRNTETQKHRVDHFELRASVVQWFRVLHLARLKPLVPIVICAETPANREQAPPSVQSL